ncbi:MAG: radical SAM/SPASM domain-containing protein [Candidatus Hodarchaeota archaeon]
MNYSNFKNSYDFAKRIVQFSKLPKKFEHAKLPLPHVIQIQTQSTCNGRCPFCPYVYTSKILPQGKMKWDLYKKIVDESLFFPTLKIFTLMLQNEPLMDKDIFRAAEYAKTKKRKDISVNIVSNGYFMNEEVIKRLIASGIDHLIISLNAFYKETYEALMPGFKFRVIMDNIDRLLSSDNKSMNISIRFLETSRNKEEIAQALSYWKTRGVRTELFSFLTNRANTVDIAEFKVPKENIFSKNRLKHAFINFFTKCCNLPFFQMNILFNGDVLICCNDWGRSPIMGNATRKSLEAIWYSSKFNRIREHIISNNYQAINPCRNCSTPEYYQ